MNDYIYLCLPAPPASADGRVLFLAVDHQRLHDDVVVLVDYENVRRSIYRAAVGAETDFDPIALAELVVQRRKRPSRLKSVRIYRGIPDRHRESRKARADGRRRQRWLRDSRAVFIGRQLQYQRESSVGREKGIDTALAIDLVSLAFWSPTDVFVVASRDTDIEPAIELVLGGKLGERVVEVVGVRGRSRLRGQIGPVPWCHYLSREDFEAIRDDA